MADSDTAAGDAADIDSDARGTTNPDNEATRPVPRRGRPAVMLAQEHANLGRGGTAGSGPHLPVITSPGGTSTHSPSGPREAPLVEFARTGGGAATVTAGATPPPASASPAPWQSRTPGGTTVVSPTSPMSEDGSRRSGGSSGSGQEHNHDDRRRVKFVRARVTTRSRVSEACGHTVASCCFGGGKTASGGLYGVITDKRNMALLCLFALGVVLSVVGHSIVEQDSIDREKDAARALAAAGFDSIVRALDGWERASLAYAAGVAALMHADGANTTINPAAYDIVDEQFTLHNGGMSEGGAFQLRVPGYARPWVEERWTAYYNNTLGAVSRPGGVVIHNIPGASHVPLPTEAGSDEPYYPIMLTASTVPMAFTLGVDLTRLPGGAGTDRLRAITKAIELARPTATAPVVVPLTSEASFIVYTSVGDATSGFGGDGPIGVIGSGISSTLMAAMFLETLNGGLGDAVADAAATQSEEEGSSTGGASIDEVDASEKLSFNVHVVIDDVTDADAEGGSVSNLVDLWTRNAAFEHTTTLLDRTLSWVGRSWHVTMSRVEAELIAGADATTPRIVRLAGILGSALIVLSLRMALNECERRDRIKLIKMRADVAKDTHEKLVTYIAHELRNPLHHLSGGLELFAEDHALIMTATMKDELQQLAGSVSQMRLVTNDIIDVRTLESGEVTVDPRPTDVRGVLRDLTNQMRNTVTTETKLCVVVERTLPPLLVTDPLRLRQLMGNALHNACKATDSGTIALVVRTFRSSKWLLIEIRNTGEGLGGVDGEVLLGGASDGSSKSVTSAESVDPVRGRTPKRKQKKQVPAKVLREVQTWFKESTRSAAGEEVLLPTALEAEFDSHTVTRSALDSGKDDGDADGSSYSGSRGAAGAGAGDHGEPGHGGKSSKGRSGSSRDRSKRSSTVKVDVLLKASGFGLGLPLCRRITQAMGGSIGLLDVTGFTRFWCLLPVSVDKPGGQKKAAQQGKVAAGNEATSARHVAVSVTFEADSTAASQGATEAKKTDSIRSPASGGSVPPAPEHLKGLYVIAVDDEKLLRKLIGRFLSRLGVHATLLEDGDELEAALAAHEAAGHEVCCVLLDIVMRRSDGADICRKVRANGVTLPIYAMTGNADRTSAAKYRAWGFSGMLAKPFSADNTRAVIEHAQSGAEKWMIQTQRGLSPLTSGSKGSDNSPDAGDGGAS